MDNSTTFQRMRWFAIGCGLVGSCMQMPGAYGQGTNQQLAPTQQSGLQGSGGQASVLVRYASTNKTPVYCGPGDDFYVTSQLRVGTAVEVFHQTKTGWCAVRPPDGSFGWLAAENAYLLPGGTVAEIVGTKVPAWIGSNLETPKQFRWQVELQPSQQVQVLGESKQKIDPDTERLWYRIAPPQGEFRWIKASALSERAPIADPNDPPMETTSPVLANAAKPRDMGVVTASYGVPAENPQSNAKKPNTQPSKSPTPNTATANKDNSGLTKKTRTVTKQGASPAKGSKSLIVQDSGVQTAQHAEPVTAQPIVINQQEQPYQLGEGEYVVGSEEVVSDHIIGEGGGPAPMHSGVAIDDEEPIQEGHPAHTGRFRSPFHFEGDDTSFAEWNAINSHPGRLLVRPLNGILGLIGFGISEAEITEPTHPIGKGRWHQVTEPAMDPSLRARLDSLPRPGRRWTPEASSEMIYEGDYQTAPIDSNSNSNMGSRSLLQPLSSSLFPNRNPVGTGLANPVDPWHAPATLGPSSTSLTSRGSALSDIPRSSMYAPNTPPVSTASANVSGDAEPLHLTTPQLQDALLELTQIVALPTDQWDFRKIHAYASEWVERGGSSIERGEARLLVERIQQFESLRLRWNGQHLASTPNFSNPSGSAAGASTADYRALGSGPSPATSASYSGSSNDEASLATAQQADASGILTSVFTSRPGQPEFALTDASKNVIAYVVPSPGMNLRRYVNQPVAIYGTRGYLPELASKQIVADRVVRLR